MGYIKAILAFIGQVLGFTKWTVTRKDQRQEKAHQAKAAKEFAENDNEITRLYRDTPDPPR